MKFIVRLILVYLFSLLLYLIPSKFLTLDFFRIKEVKISGDSKILSSELTKLVQKIYNSNIWEIDTKELESYLKKDIRIEDVKITTPALGRLDIEIKERELAYYLQLRNEIYLLDENGDIFGTLKEKPEKDTYFLVAKDESEIENLLKLSKKLDDYLLKVLVSQIYIKDKDCIEIVLMDGTIIKTNLDVYDEKYKVLETLYSELVKTRKIEYIDLRFNDFIVKSSEDKK